jgi:hypothetical protein
MLRLMGQGAYRTQRTWYILLPSVGPPLAPFPKSTYHWPSKEDEAVQKNVAGVPAKMGSIAGHFVP